MRIVGIILCGFVWISTTRGAAVDYRDLKTTRLPYGEAVTISGLLSGLTVKVQEGGKTVDKNLSDYFSITKVSLTYTVSGLAPVSVDGNLSGDNWSVVTEKLPENSQVRFQFRFTGNIKEAVANSVLDGVFTDTRFGTELDSFFALAAQNDVAVQAAGAKVFLERLTPIIESRLPANLKAAAKNTTAGALIFPLANLKTNLRDMAAVTAPVPGVTADMAPAAAAAAVAAFEKSLGVTEPLTVDLAEKQPQSSSEERKKRATMMAAAQFKLNFQQLRGSLIKTVVAEYEISSELTALADIKDFEKYAGLDYGAVYIPRVEALRQFFTINIYLGAVEDKPTGMTEVVDENGNKKKSSRAEWLRQRFSLTFGMSIGDISSQDSSKIKGDNVFLYGIGFRLNKYFRLTTGAAVFRDARNDRLSHGLMLGPSVDLTAFRYIRGLFGKASSRD